MEHYIDIVLDEQRSLSETELSAARQKLHEMVRSEFDPTRSIDRLAGNNERAGRAHAILNLLVADSLKERKSNLTIGKVKAHIKQEISKYLKIEAGD